MVAGQRMTDTSSLFDKLIHMKLHPQREAVYPKRPSEVSQVGWSRPRGSADRGEVKPLGKVAIQSVPQ